MFQTEPLAEDLEVTGEIEVRLFASTSAVDTDFTAKLIDVYPPSEDWPGGFDLNIGRYIQTEMTAEVDVEAALAAYWQARDELRAAERVLDEKLKAAGFGA